MANSQTDKINNKSDQKSAPEDVADIKHKLAMRMVFAGVMIIALLGGLALFDYYSAQPEHEVAAPPAFTEPVPVAKKMVTQPVTPAEPAAPAEVKPVEPEATSAPVDKAAPRVDTPPPPEVAARPALPRASAPAARVAASPVPASPTVPSSPSSPATSAEARATPLAEQTETGATPPASQVPLAAPPRLSSGYALQAGVFSDPRRAEELHARLTLAGIPSTIEARVQVGPFKNKAGAEAAREKLKALGIDTVMLLPKGAKR